MKRSDISPKLKLSVMHYPSQRLSKFGQIEWETVRGPYKSKQWILIRLEKELNKILYTTTILAVICNPMLFNKKTKYECQAIFTSGRLTN